MDEMKNFKMEMKKMELDFEQDISRMRMMKDIEISRIRAPIFQEAIKSEGTARRYFVQTMTEKAFDDPTLLSVFSNRNKLTLMRNQNYFAVACPRCNRESFDVPKLPGNYTYKCQNKFLLFDVPLVQIDIGYNGSISVKAK
ncbi:hypothetical protein JYT44_03040 [Caldithrix abyssi]|nr:hypothetical protein [Caldithrix abyssi]